MFYTIPFAYWTLKTPQAARRFNDYHANIRIYVTIASTLLTTIIYSTVYPESLVALIGMGYCIRTASTVYALEVAAKVCVCTLAGRFLCLMLRLPKKRGSAFFQPIRVRCLGFRA